MILIAAICVFYSEDDVLVGYRAMAQADANAANTVYDAKRFIGKSFGKDELATEAGRYEFKVRYKWLKVRPKK